MIKKKLLSLLLLVFCINGFVPVYGMQERRALSNQMAVFIGSALVCGFTGRGLMYRHYTSNDWRWPVDFYGCVGSAVLCIGSSLAFLDNMSKK